MQIGPYSAAQIANAKTIFSFWSNYAKPWHAVGFVANADRETSLNPKAVGDRDTAFGIGQWHGERVLDILDGCEIELRTASLENQLIAMHWELTNVESPAWKEIMAATSCTEASVAICKYYERAGAADALSRSVALAAYWKVKLGVSDPA